MTDARSAVLPHLREILGPRGMLTDPADTAAYAEDWRRLYQGRTAAVLRPATTAELASAVKLCAEAGVPLVPQGGNTSMVGGATPSDDGRELVVSLARLNRIRDLDRIDMTMTAEAGITLQAAQEAAAEADCLLPLSIPSEGTAQIGGILSTNAGGNNTVRYGNAREMVLGLEVVLPDGQVWNGLRRLRKDNTGYALRHLFIGAEGTLGIITAAVLKLVPRPRETEVALAAVASPEAALDLFGRLQSHDAAVVNAFEYMSGAGVGFVLKHIEGAILPLAAPADHYALIELATTRENAGLRSGLETVLEQALATGAITDAVIAESEAQRRALWRLREEHSEAQKREGASIKNDVSVPVSKVPELIRRATAACAALVPGVRPVPFGHIGDGNIHYDVIRPEGGSDAEHSARRDQGSRLVHDLVASLGGSISAEHGLGSMKTEEARRYKSPVEVAALEAIRRALDPKRIMNPRVLF